MTAMLIMAATALVGASGKYAWGMMCDRFDPKRVAIVMSVLNAFGLSLALVKGSTAALLIFVVVFGFSMGGIMSTFPIILSSPPFSAGKILRTSSDIFQSFWFFRYSDTSSPAGVSISPAPMIPHTVSLSAWM